MNSTSSTDKYNFRHEREREHAIESMRAYIGNKPEQVKFLEQLMAPALADRVDLSVIDACCGIGDLIHFLSQDYPDVNFTGVDKAEFLIREAQTNASSDKVSFVTGDIYELSKLFGEKSFDISVCKQTISWLPRYEQAVRELMAVAREAVFITSLFYDGRIDFETRIREYTTDSGREDFHSYYNVYSFPVFRDFCLRHGAKEVSGFDFQIGIDLPRPENPDRMGTYTEKLESGERLQISGALLMPWKIVRIDL
jgi:ubiquinone/menaquinone biosynthesis C-methylase UbiE